MSELEQSWTQSWAVHMQTERTQHLEVIGSGSAAFAAVLFVAAVAAVEAVAVAVAVAAQRQGEECEQQ